MVFYSLTKFSLLSLAVSVPCKVLGEVSSSSFPVDSVREEQVEAFINEIGESIESLSPKPNNFGALIVSLAKLNPTAGERFSPDGVIDSYNEAVEIAYDDDAILAMPLTNYLDEVADIDGIAALEKHKQAIINDPPQDLSADEVNALILDINLSKWETEVLSSGELRNRNLGDVPLWVKFLLELFGIAVSDFVKDKCLKFLIKLALAIIKCALLFPSLSCLLIPYYIWQVFRKCGNSVYEDPCLTSPDPCCGVHCIQGYYCVGGECVEDPYFEGCQDDSDCPPDEQCGPNGICIPL